MRARFRTLALSAAQAAVALAILWFGGNVLVESWTASRPGALTFDWGAAAWALPCLALAYYCFMRLSRTAVRLLGFPLDWRQTFRVWSVPQAGSYVPGKVWWVLLRFRQLRAQGAPAAVAAADVYVEEAVMVVGCVAVGLFGLVGLVAGDLLRIAGAATALAGVSSLLLVPRVSSFFFRRVAAALGTAAPPPALPLAGTVRLLLHVVGIWTFFGLAFAAVCFSVSPGLAAREIPRLVGVYAMAWLAGVLSMLPGGLVAREGLLGYLLGGVVGHREVIVAAAIMRVATVGCELSLAALSLALTGVHAGRRRS